MKIKVVLLFVLVSVLFSISNLSAQNKLPQFSAEFSGDSLNGFDEEAVRQDALADGISGFSYLKLLEVRKRLFIYAKYNLNNYSEILDGSYFNLSGSNFPATLSSKQIGNTASIANAPCTNEGFETGNISGWLCTQGTNTNSCSYPVTTNTISFPNSSFITTSVTPFVDPVFNVTITNSPFSGSVVAKINDQFINAGEAVKLSQTFSVTNSNFLYEFAYIAMMATQHTCCQQPFMRVSVRDNVGNLLSCPLFTFAPPPPTGPSCSSSGIIWAPQTTVTTSQGVFQARYNSTWQKYSIDLTNYIGTNVSIEVVVADCSPTGHFGYAYFDSNCNQLGFTLGTPSGTTFVAAPTQTVNITGLCATTATLTAPTGLGPYTWNGPPGSGITSNTNQVISTNVAGLYTISMNPAGSCVPINRVINLNFAPPTTLVATSTMICSGTNATLSASGATSYTWNGTFATPSIVVNPTTTTIYSLTSKTGTCIGNYTQQITVNPNPTVIVSNPSGSVCAGGGGVTLTATGAGAGGTYSWTPAGLTGSAAVVSPTSATVYTAIGTSSDGCVGTGTTLVGVTTTVVTGVVNLTNPSSSVCAGTPVSLLCYNALAYTINPGNITTANFASVTPSLTTTYTVTGGVGVCSSTAAITVSIDPGPSMTVTGTPSLTCPYISASLTALAPTSLGFTWTPPGSSYGGTTSTHIVTPTTTTTYSVQGINSAGCRSTYTITQNVAPIPNITITPATSSICIGSSIVLTASGGSTYTWNPGSVINASISLSPTTTSNYTVISSNGTCTSSATQSVQVVPLPNTSAVASPTVVCSGNAITLTGGGATTYSWSPGSFTTAVVTLTPASSTIYTVTGSSAGCSKNATVAITVNPNPTIGVVASPTAICPGFSSTLTPNGALSYSLNGLFITGLSPFVVTPPSTNTYTMSGTNSFGCISSTIFTMVVNPTPTINLTAGSSSICVGNSTSLSATGAASYTWNPGALNGSLVSVSPTVTTVYTATGTSAQGCNGSNTINITVVPNPTVTASASPTAICVGASATLSAIGANSYTWSTGSTASTSIVSPTASAIYAVTGSSNGCTNTKTVQVTVNPLPTLVATATPTAVCPGFSSVLNATGGATYTWNPGGLTGASATVTPASTTVYTLTGLSALGCASTQTVQLVVNPLPAITASANPASVCAGSSATLSAGGAISYTWQPGSLPGSAVIVTPTATTVYTVTGTSSLGCNSTATVTVIRVPNPTVTAAASPTSVCLGGPAILTANGATTYNWSTGATGSLVVVTPTTTTTYTVSGLTSGCSGTAAVTVIVNPLPTLTVSATPTAVCLGGSSNLSAAGAVSYTWLPGSLSGANVTVTPSVTTVYTVSGISAAGCSSSKTVQVVVNPTPVVLASSIPSSVCAGGNVALSANGANTYTWLPGSLSGANVTVTPATTTIYTVTATSSLSCPGQATVLVTVVPIPTITASSTPTAICVGATAVLSATGATSYSWNPGSLSGSTVSVSPSVTTIYTITGSAAGCTSTKTISLVVNPLPFIAAIANPTSVCSGATSTLVAGGGVSYTWTPGASNASLFPVTPAITTVYTLTGASAAGCISTATTQVVVNPAPSLSVSPSAFTICSGGFVTLIASGATNYTWIPGGATTSTISANPTVTTVYTVNGTNSFGCSGAQTATVTVAPLPVVTATATSTLICPGGSATLTANGATSYTWSTGGLTSAIVVTPSVTTTYSVSGTLGSCTSTLTTITVSVGTAPSLTITGNTTVCAGFSASLTASGATGYTWNPGGSTGANFVVTPASSTTYTLTGSNALGCTSTKTVAVQVNPNPAIVATALTPTICAGSGTSLTATGAASYTWNPGNISGNPVFVTPSVTTIYTVTGTSSLGCTSQTNVTVFVQPNPVITASASPASICPGGSSTLTAVGASSFVWSTTVMASSIVVSPSVTTIYSVAGVVGTCTSAIVTLTVVVNPLPSLTVAASPTAVCPGGTVTLSASGATSYTWNPGGALTSSISVTPLSTTVYTVTGKNGFNCSSTTTLSVVVNPNPTVTASASPTSICSGQSANLNANGATSYTWLPGSSTGSTTVVNPTLSTTYTVTGSSLGCTSTATVNLTVNPLPVITATASPASICTGNSSTLSASGGTAYTWIPGSLSGASVVVTPTLNTAYIVTGTNNLGCSNTQTVSVTVNSVPTLSISSTSPTLCSGSSATLTGSGTLSYTWMPGNITSATVSVNPATTTVYTLTGSNGFGCTTSMMFTLNVVPTPTISITASNPTVCSGSSSTLTATGAVNYTWSPIGTSGSVAVVNPTSTTVYTLTGDAGGCVTTNTVGVFVNPLPNITAGASPTNICNGAIATLTSSGAVSYSWTPGNLSGSSVTVAPSVSTVYTVTATSSLSCVNTQTVSLIVSPTPTVTASAASTAVCIGGSTSLTANGATNYTWMPGALTGSQVVVSPSVNTVYTVTGDNGAVCTNSTTILIGVNSLPIVAAAANPTAVCAGGSLTLTATGALNYTWSPVAATGGTATDNPTVTTTYSVLGQDSNGCINQGTTNVVVNPLPTLTTIATPTAICFGSTQTVTLSTSGALSYTWSPIASNSNSITDTPTITSTYSVSGTDALGCIGNSTVSVFVVPIPTITVIPANATVCLGFSATLTASGAANYTWLPSGGTSSVEVVTPSVTSNYTVIGDNGGGCPTIFTVNVFVNPLPANVTATCSGTITCSSPTVSLSGSTSNTNVSYSWSGPLSYTSSLQNPTGISAWGVYTLAVTDNVTGCVATTTVNVPTDNSIPSVTATTSGSITCNTATVTLNAANTTTNAGYVWSGPSGFTATVQSPTTTVAGVYTVVVIDLTSTCSSTAVVTVGTHTNVTITSTITPATCSAGVTNNDGSIIVAGFAALDKFDIVSGSSYTGTATYTSATIIPSNGILTNNLANPVVTTFFTVRFFDAQGCIKDTTLLLVPVDCVPKILGVAKAVASTSLNTDGTYNVKYKVVVKNYSSAPLTNVSITENLNNTFPLPATFTLVTAPVSSSTLSGLTINSGFDGFSSSNMVVSATSSIAANGVDTLSFNVKVKVNGVFGPYKNTVTASAVDVNSVTVRDSSANGLNPDPDGDNNPNNNNIPTPINFTPNLFFGLTKVGAVNKITDGNFDVSYTITVHNLGNDTLRNVSVNDVLNGNTIKAPATYSLKSGPIATGALIANTAYNGNSVVALLGSGSKMLPGTSSDISFTINVTTNTNDSLVISNSANGDAQAIVSGSNVTVRDTSNSGTNPDVNGNGVWNEPADNVPTKLTLSGIYTNTLVSNEPLFIPEGFSPNDDGNNDTWKIKGLPSNMDCSIIIYNRWGNRVYISSNYANSLPWDGRPNVSGTFGKDLLPQGTYYYILDIKGSGMKPKTGYVVLQY